jgi:hypothetical protein
MYEGIGSFDFRWIVVENRRWESSLGIVVGSRRCQALIQVLMKFNLAAYIAIAIVRLSVLSIVASARSPRTNDQRN